jgi:hypothetical protein
MKLRLIINTTAILLAIALGSLTVSLCGLYFVVGRQIDSVMQEPQELKLSSLPPTAFKILDLQYPSSSKCTVTGMFQVNEQNCAIEGQLIKTITPPRPATLKYFFDNMLGMFYLSNNYSADRIKESFLNRIYWGFDSAPIKGITSASRYYFKKEIQDLNNDELAEIFVLLKAPGYYLNPKNSEKLKLQKQNLLRQLNEAAADHN